MNKVISDTAEYGCYLYTHRCVPLLKDFFTKVDTDIIGTKFNKGDNGVDNMTLIQIDEAIYNHPVEEIGRELRGHMTAMKKIAVGA
jgi:ketol-acid reductoisomerase